MARVSGRVMLRPIRVGLLVRETTSAALHEAVQLSTRTWGGIAFPILVASTQQEDTLRQARELGVDCLYAIDEDEELATTRKQPGFSWRSLGGGGVFERGFDGVRDHALPASSLYSWLSQSNTADPSYVTWSENHPQRDLLAVLYGEFGSDEGGMEDRRVYANLFPTVVLPDDSWLPSEAATLPAQLHVTAQDVELRPFYLHHAAVVVRPEEPRDLLAFWNIRASGCSAIPWVLGGETASTTSLERWLDQVVSLVRFDGSPVPVDVLLPRASTRPPRSPISWPGKASPT